jgi:hypothetical protein
MNEIQGFECFLEINNMSLILYFCFQSRALYLETAFFHKA